MDSYSILTEILYSIIKSNKSLTLLDTQIGDVKVDIFIIPHEIYICERVKETEH